MYSTVLSSIALLFGLLAFITAMQARSDLNNINQNWEVLYAYHDRVRSLVVLTEKQKDINEYLVKEMKTLDDMCRKVY